MIHIEKGLGQLPFPGLQRFVHYMLGITNEDESNMDDHHHAPAVHCMRDNKRDAE